MVAVKKAKKKIKKARVKKYDLKDIDPRKALTKDQEAHLDEIMALTNYSIPADKMNFEAAAKSVIAGMKNKYSRKNIHGKDIH